MIQALKLPSDFIPTARHPAASSPHESQLLEQARGGAKSAMGQLLSAHQSYLIRVARTAISVKLQSKLDPADLVQDSLLDAFRNLDQFNGVTPQQFRAWLRRILLNNAADVARRYQQTKKRRSSLEVSLDSAEGALSVAVNSLPSECADNSELQAILDRALAELPVHLRYVILLRQHESHSFAAIGAQTGRSSEAARKLWNRAIARLRIAVATNC